MDYLSHLGSWDLYPVSGKSKEVQSSLRLVKSFDKYTWMLMAISVVVVALSIIHIDRMNAYWKNLTTKDILHQSKVGDGRLFYFEPYLSCFQVFS